MVKIFRLRLQAIRTRTSKTQRSSQGISSGWLLYWRSGIVTVCGQGTTKGAVYPGDHKQSRALRQHATGSKVCSSSRRRGRFAAEKLSLINSTCEECSRSARKRSSLSRVVKRTSCIAPGSCTSALRVSRKKVSVPPTSPGTMKRVLTPRRNTPLFWRMGEFQTIVEDFFPFISPAAETRTYRDMNKQCPSGRNNGEGSAPSICRPRQ